MKALFNECIASEPLHLRNNWKFDLWYDEDYDGFNDDLRNHLKGICSASQPAGQQHFNLVLHSLAVRKDPLGGVTHYGNSTERGLHLDYAWKELRCGCC